MKIQYICCALSVLFIVTTVRCNAQPQCDVVGAVLVLFKIEMANSTAMQDYGDGLIFDALASSDTYRGANFSDIMVAMENAIIEDILIVYERIQAIAADNEDFVIYTLSNTFNVDYTTARKFTEIVGSGEVAQCCADVLQCSVVY